MRYVFMGAYCTRRISPFMDYADKSSDRTAVLRERCFRLLSINCLPTVPCFIFALALALRAPLTTYRLNAFESCLTPTRHARRTILRTFRETATETRIRRGMRKRRGLRRVRTLSQYYGHAILISLRLTAKDLSHVPCKFFKVGSCTAGSSCPFSHTILEPGQAKEVCAWFVKGNCKFGHKCALAHILPGQSMSMDRKNKKAAQAAASAANSAGRDGQRTGRSQKGASQGSRNGSSAPRNPLLSGSTAPTRSLSSSRSVIPMPLKATLSPSAPAPPVQNTDFASFGLPDETNKLPNAPAQGKTSTALVGSVVPPSDHTAEPDMGRKSEELSIHHEGHRLFPLTPVALLTGV